MKKIVIALAGQPNGGKSTLFNSLTGAKQFVANYPGVTVEKMTGWYGRKGEKFEVVDLPGTYSLTSYSPEERVTRDFLLGEKPSAVINVLDSSNLKRSLYLTVQLLEMKIPLLLDLNMMDIAQKSGLEIDLRGMSETLGIPVLGTSIRSGEGRDELLSAIDTMAEGGGKKGTFSLSYPHLQEPLVEMERLLSSEATIGETYPPFWLAVKLLEGDKDAAKIVERALGEDNAILRRAEEIRETFEKTHDQPVELYICSCRHKAATDIASRFVTRKNASEVTLSDRLDRVICNKIAGPVILLGIIYALYRLSIVEGYRLTNYTWPILAWFRDSIESLLPRPGFIHIPIFREFVMWCVNSVNALLNYIPIFFILFALIAILEDSGYMPRMAFIMHRILSRFGLHGQSTLSMVLSGVVVGGCIVPGVMSTKGIPDEKSRIATILTLPMLNCLAKTPLYILLINIYFLEQKGLVMLFISTISLLFVLPMAKLLSGTVLKNKPTAPFIMEMPPYHVPTVRGVLGRAVERVWMYIRKITTVVAAVAVVLFALLQFPGIDAESLAGFNARKDASIAEFLSQTEGNPYTEKLKTEDEILSLILFQEDYKQARRKSGGDMTKTNKEFETRNATFFKIITDKKDKDARAVDRALRGVSNERRSILAEMRHKRIENSILGKIGRAIEPVTKWAGFNWRVNIAVLSSLAAKESLVATLGALYQPMAEDSEEGKEGDAPLESRIASQETGFTPLHAVALMVFMVLCPPCFPSAIAIKVQTGSFRWMLFSFFYPLVFGLCAATLIFTGGNALGLNAMQAMWGFYLIPLLLTVLMGLVDNRKDSESC